MQLRLSSLSSLTIMIQPRVFEQFHMFWYRATDQYAGKVVRNLQNMNVKWFPLDYRNSVSRNNHENILKTFLSCDVKFNFVSL